MKPFRYPMPPSTVISAPVIDQYVQLPELFSCAGDNFPPVRRARDIVPKEQRPTPHRIDKRGARLLQICQHDICAFRHKQRCGGSTLPPARTGNDRNFTFKPFRHHRPRFATAFRDTIGPAELAGHPIYRTCLKSDPIAALQGENRSRFRGGRYRIPHLLKNASDLCNLFRVRLCKLTTSDGQRILQSNP